MAQPRGIGWLPAPCGMARGAAGARRRVDPQARPRRPQYKAESTRRARGRREPAFPPGRCGRLRGGRVVLNRSEFAAFPKDPSALAIGAYPAPHPQSPRLCPRWPYFGCSKTGGGGADGGRPASFAWLQLRQAKSLCPTLGSGSAWDPSLQPFTMPCPVPRPSLLEGAPPPSSEAPGGPREAQ